MPEHSPPCGPKNFFAAGSVSNSVFCFFATGGRGGGAAVAVGPTMPPVEVTGDGASGGPIMLAPVIVPNIMKVEGGQSAMNDKADWSKREGSSLTTDPKIKKMDSQN